MSPIDDLQVLDKFDEIQMYIIQEDVIKKTKNFLIEQNIDPKFSKKYLSSIIFFKFKSEFQNISNTFSEVIDLVYKKEDLKTNLPIFVQELSEWKKKDVNETLGDLHSMKEQTDSSFKECEDEDCKKCFENQKHILEVAEDFYKIFENSS